MNEQGLIREKEAETFETVLSKVRKTNNREINVSSRLGQRYRDVVAPNRSQRQKPQPQLQNQLPANKTYQSWRSREDAAGEAKRQNVEIEITNLKAKAKLLHKRQKHELDQLGCRTEPQYRKEMANILEGRLLTTRCHC